MAKQVINVGTADLAGDGDALRTAFTKVNDNFTELYNALGNGTTIAANTGTLVSNAYAIATYQSNTALTEVAISLTFEPSDTETEELPKIPCIVKLSD